MWIGRWFTGLCSLFLVKISARLLKNIQPRVELKDSHSFQERTACATPIACASSCAVIGVQLYHSVSVDHDILDSSSQWSTNQQGKSSFHISIKPVYLYHRPLLPSSQHRYCSSFLHSSHAARVGLGDSSAQVPLELFLIWASKRSVKQLQQLLGGLGHLLFLPKHLFGFGHLPSWHLPTQLQELLSQLAPTFEQLNGALLGALSSVEYLDPTFLVRLFWSCLNMVYNIYILLYIGICTVSDSNVRNPCFS